MKKSLRSKNKHFLPALCSILLIGSLIAGCGSAAVQNETTTVAASTAAQTAVEGTTVSAEPTTAEPEKTPVSAVSDGTYEMAVILSGGSGKAKVLSPCIVTVSDGKATATIQWNSDKYDYMRIGEVKFEPVSTEGGSVFEIPVEAFDTELSVAADTIAMSTPHEIEYTLYFDYSGKRSEQTEEENISAGIMGDRTAPETLAGLALTDSMELLYAECFSVATYEGGYQLVIIAGSDAYLLVPEGMSVPAGLPDDIAVLCQPLSDIYLAASSAMDLFRQLDALDCISMTSTTKNNWSLPEVVSALDAGTMTYIGKYSSPDYEMLVSSGCPLAIESTMIYHSPDVKEQIEDLGIPVLVERSSYETNPLGRVEWIRLYGCLTGRQEEADAYFLSCAEQLKAITSEETTGKTVAFFYISSTGYANIRTPGDYLSKMIELAGGIYVFSDIETSGTGSTMNLQMEAFYAGARDADIIIYSSSITGGVKDIRDLLGKSELLADFAAVKSGNVWCTEKNVFQGSAAVTDIIADIHAIVTGAADNTDTLTYLYRLK